MSKEMKKQYQKDRDVFELDKSGGYYCRHVAAMTSEDLHSKSDIAAELGHRDMVNDRLVEKNAALREALRLKEAECEALASDISRIVSAAADAYLSGSEQQHVDHLYRVIRDASGKLYSD